MVAQRATPQIRHSDLKEMAYRDRGGGYPLYLFPSPLGRGYIFVAARGKGI